MSKAFQIPLFLQPLGLVIWKIIIIKLILFSKLSHLGFNLKIQAQLFENNRCVQYAEMIVQFIHVVKNIKNIANTLCHVLCIVVVEKVTFTCCSHGELGLLKYKFFFFFFDRLKSHPPSQYFNLHIINYIISRSWPTNCPH